MKGGELMGIKVKGLDALQRELKRMADKAKELEGEHTVPLSKLLTPEFLASISTYNSYEEFMEMLGIESNEDLEDMDDSELNLKVSEISQFDTWQDLLNAATEEYISSMF